MKIHGCVFCYLDKKIVIHRGKSFSLIVDPYPLVTGHMMIVSHVHYSCVADVDISDQDEYFAFKDTVEAWYKRQNIPWISYEHGRAGGCLLSKTGECHHMHVHFLPHDMRLNQKIQKDFSGYLAPKGQDIGSFSHAFGHYLFAQDAYDGPVFYPVHTKKVPPHYIRTLIAEHLHQREKKNWQSYTAYQICPKTLQTLRQAFS